MNQLNRKLVVEAARNTFGTTKITKEQLNYLLSHLKASTYALEHHTIKGFPLTFHVGGRNEELMRGHRPWQIQLLNDTHPNKVVIKSRQLGLSEVGVMEIIHWLDTHSYAGVRGLYTFPTLSQLNDFVATRIDNVLKSGYYATILNKNVNSLQKKQIRDAILYFRSSQKGSMVEGIDIDFTSMDE